MHYVYKPRLQCSSDFLKQYEMQKHKIEDESDYSDMTRILPVY